MTANGVKSMITSFQIDHNVILSKDDDGAGTYGPKTRAALAAAHVRYTLLHNLEQDAIDAARKQMLDERTAWNQRYSIAQKYVSYIGSPRIGDRGNNVAILQTVLKGTGFFQGKSTGVMRGTTVIALKKYQKSRGLAQTGKIDINTQLALAEDAMEA